MGYPLSPVHRRFIATEIAIGTVLGSVLPATGMYLTIGPFPMPVAGSEGLGLFLLKNALGMGAVMTLVMTLATRMRVRRGGAPALGWTRDAQPLLRLMPRAILLRALLFGLCAVALPGWLAFALAHGSRVDTIDRLPFALVMAASSATVALCLIPFILIGAMSDRRSPAMEPSA